MSVTVAAFPRWRSPRPVLGLSIPIQVSFQATSIVLLRSRLPGFPTDIL